MDEICKMDDCFEKNKTVRKRKVAIKNLQIQTLISFAF
jgi:hypothetical protein